MASESRLRCGFGHSVATTKAMNVFWMILHVEIALTLCSLQVSRHAMLNASQQRPQVSASACSAVCLVGSVGRGQGSACRGR